MKWLDFGSSCSHSKASLSEYSTSLSPELDRIRSLRQLPSLAALSLNGSDVAVGVTGRRNAYFEPLVTEDDVFKLGSNTKAMTATLLARTFEESSYPRKISWDTTIPLALLFSGVLIHPGHYRTTIAQIASHRSGIVDSEGGAPPEFAKLYDPRLTPMEARKLSIVAALREPPAIEPGTEFNYSNTGYMLLGFIIETLASTTSDPVSFEELLQKKLFDPLDMTSCGFGVGPPLKSRTGIENPWPHTASRWGPVPVYPNKLADIPDAMGPAGSVYCSMSDYSKFLQLHIDGWQGRSTRVLRKESFTWLHRSAFGQAYTFGGWNRNTIEAPWGDGSEKVTRLSHEGSNLRNYVTAWVFPESEYAVAGFTNIGGTAAQSGCEDVVRGLSEGDIVL